MASLGCSISTGRHAHAFGAAGQPKYSPVQLWRGTGHVGLPANGGDDLSRHRHEPEFEKDLHLLTALFGRSYRGSARQYAERLLNRFGSIPALLQANEADLRPGPNQPREILNLIADLRQIVSRVLRKEIETGPVFPSTQALIDYLFGTMAHIRQECFHVLYLDGRNGLIGEEKLSQGTVNAVTIYPREVLRKALSLDASALILVHNHPCGSPQPSPADIDLTRKLASAAQQFDLSLLDHIVVARSGWLSFKAEGLL